MERIDSHQHFWHYTAGEYSWIDETMATLRRDFLPLDLQPKLKACGFAGSIAVQARQTLEETAWLLSLAAEDAMIAGVVGWMPLTSEGLKDELDRLPNRGWLCGVRHVLQDEPNEELMCSAGFQRGLRVLAEDGLVYDLLVYQRQLEAACALVDRHPNLVFVLDHVGKPRIVEGALEPWRTQLRELARRPNVFCKLSGMVTEAHWNEWTPEALTRYYDVVMECFGAPRIMFGSDWPVCTLAASYEVWCETVEHWLGSSSHPEREAILGGTAERVYRLGRGAEPRRKN